MANADTTAPVLTSLTLPKTIDVTHGGSYFNFSAGATDKGSGVSQILVELDHSYQNQYNNSSYVSFYDSTDSFSDGKSTASEYFNSTSAAGTYNISDVYVYDKAGNYTEYTASQLASMGIKTSFDVKSSTQADTTAPVLTSLTLPKTIDVTHGGSYFNFSAAATDKGSGVSQILVELDHSYQNQYSNSSYVSFYDSTDSFSDGRSMANEYFNSTSAAGTYNISDVYVYDKAGNYTEYTASQLASMGIKTSFDVKSSTQADTTAPVLTSLTLPKTIDVTHGGSYFDFSAGAADKGSGVSQVLVELDHSYQNQYSNSSYVSFYDSTDSFSDGKSTASEYFNSTSAAGTYNISNVYVYDKAGNYTEYTASQLASMQIGTSFQIVDHTATVTASITAPASVTEGHDVSLPLTFTLKDAATASTDITITLDQADTTTTGIDIGSYAASYSISQSPAGDYAIKLPSITLPDGAHATGGTLALSVHATGQVFDSGTDTEIVRIHVDDTDQTGTKHNDHLTGSAYDDRLVGLAGNDTLDGGAGHDRLVGGTGDDTYVVDSAHDSITELADQGVDTVISSLNWTLGDNLDNLTLIGVKDIGATGNGLNNWIVGNTGDNIIYGLDGDDLLDGAAGHDTLVGGKGDDTYVVDSAHDHVTELGSEGTDTVQSSLNWTLGSNLEALLLTGTRGSSGIGNALANTISGNSGDNHLSGLAGDDTITGGNGADTITGGAGRDIVSGGKGADAFLFAAGDFAGIKADTCDRISDYQTGYDRIDLHAVDAIQSGSDNAFRFIGTAAFDGLAGELRYFVSHGVAYLEGDTNGDMKDDLRIALDHVTVLSTTDFIL